jgi:hypothetical protein
METQVELFDSEPRGGEDLAMIVGHGDGERNPLATTQGEPDLAGLRVEVEGGGGSPEEGSVDVGGPRRDSHSNPPSMSRGERESDLGGAEGHLSVHSGLERAVADEAAELAPGSGAGGEGMTQALVDEKPKLVEEDPSRTRKVRGGSKDERADDGRHRQKTDGRKIEDHLPVKRERWARPARTGESPE